MLGNLYMQVGKSTLMSPPLTAFTWYMGMAETLRCKQLQVNPRYSDPSGMGEADWQEQQDGRKLSHRKEASVTSHPDKAKLVCVHTYEYAKKFLLWKCNR